MMNVVIKLDGASTLSQAIDTAWATSRTQIQRYFLKIIYH
jgi:hypothetical protein